MADPDWKRCLTPVLHDVIPLLTNLVGSLLLDRLLAQGIIMQHDYDEILLLKTTAIKTDVARKIVQILITTAAPNFDRFCTILHEIEGGSHLYRLLRGQLLRGRVSQPVQEETEIVFIAVDESLEGVYKLHELEIKSWMLKYLTKLYPGKTIVFEEHFPPRIMQRNSTSEPREPNFSFHKRMQLRILLPNTNSVFFESNRTLITKYLCRLMELRESDVGIVVQEGSITLVIHIPGQGLINMLINLERNCENLQFLLGVDKSAMISLGKFAYVSVSVLIDAGQKVLQAANLDLQNSLLQLNLGRNIEEVHMTKSTPGTEAGAKRFHRTVVLIGETGSGKSACGNSLAQKDLFDENDGTTGPVEVSSKVVQCEFSGLVYTIKIIDTVGIEEDSTVDEILINLGEAVHACQDGINAIFFVTGKRIRKYAREAFTSTWQLLFGPEILLYTTIIRNHYRRFEDPSGVMEDFENLDEKFYLLFDGRILYVDNSNENFDARKRSGELLRKYLIIDCEKRYVPPVPEKLKVRISELVEAKRRLKELEAQLEEARSRNTGKREAIRRLKELEAQLEEARSRNTGKRRDFPS